MSTSVVSLEAIVGRLDAIRAGRSTRRAVVALIVANAVPLAGVVVAGWDIWTLLGVYWLENVIIGVWNVPRMARAGSVVVPTVPLPGISLKAIRVASIGFFISHYGMFTLVHGMFALVILPSSVRGGSLGEFAIGADLLALVIAGIGLFVSHGVSFRENYLGRGEYRDAAVVNLMHAPYRRVVILHVVLLFGGIGASLAGSPLWLLVAFVVAKTAGDLNLHLREHGRQRQSLVGATA